MSPREESCRWLIVQAYCIWAHHQRRRYSLMSYARALGLEPTLPLLEAW
jgi:hypothetical protein